MITFDLQPSEDARVEVADYGGFATLRFFDGQASVNVFFGPDAEQLRGVACVLNDLINKKLGRPVAAALEAAE